MSGETQLRPIRVFIEFRPIIAKVIYRITASARREKVALLCLPRSVRATRRHFFSIKEYVFSDFYGNVHIFNLSIF